ncbi:MAG: oxidoreductase [Phycisphaerae bacterium]|nr:oxidoreductase [Phycisphaerae bacterium]
MNNSRRNFLSTGAAAALAPYAFSTHTEQTIRVGVIGCGGRGTGAIRNSLAASPMVRIVALGDVFEERAQSTAAKLVNESRSTVTPETTFSGFDAFKKVLSTDVDMVILATPPHFRPQHFAAAVRAGKHVFMEKPVAVDAPGVRVVIEAAAQAKDKNLSVVSGTQRRHQQPYLEAMSQLRDGRIGDVRSASCWWNQGFLWRVDRTATMTDTEWQMRNWLYFTWLSGDHIVEQHIHNIDICNWALGGPPKSATGMGGREVRTGPEWGNIFDHFSIDFEYENDVRVTSWCRQIDGCTGKVAEEIVGTKGVLRTDGGRAIITGESPWRTKGGRNPYEQEHVDLIDSITQTGPYLNEGRRIAESTMTAIMGRDSAYSGKRLQWEEALNADVRLGPTDYAFGPLPVRPASVPGS